MVASPATMDPSIIELYNCKFVVKWTADTFILYCSRRNVCVVFVVCVGCGWKIDVGFYVVGKSDQFIARIGGH